MWFSPFVGLDAPSLGYPAEVLMKRTTRRDTPKRHGASCPTIQNCEGLQNKHGFLHWVACLNPPCSKSSAGEEFSDDIRDKDSDRAIVRSRIRALSVLLFYEATRSCRTP